MKEENLIIECKKNSYAAQMEVYNLYKRQVYNASWRILRNKQDAEDAMQDAFIKGFHKIEQVKEDANLGGWFKRIAINHSLDVVRKRKKNWTEDVDDYDIGEQESESDNFEDSAISAQFIRACIEKLDDKYSVILNLYLVEDYNHREISVQLDLKESTVRNQYRRGKIKLMTLIRKNKSYEFKRIHSEK